MSKREHPSYGIMRLSRSSIGGDGAVLFGSSILHNNTIRLSISKGWEERLGNENRYYPSESLKNQYIEVEMSYNQFAEMITSLNTAGGVPVTIRSLAGQHIQPCPFENHYKRTQQEFTEKTRELAGRLNQQKAEITRLLEEKRVLSKADREWIVSTISSALQGLTDQLPFINQLFMEQMEKTMAEAKGEFESFIQNSMNRIALSALAQQPEELVKKLVATLPGERGGPEEATAQVSEDEEKPGQSMEFGGM